MASVVAACMLIANLPSAFAAGNVEAGRALALDACTGCHVVLPDQPFAPLIKRPPDFHSIVNKPATTAASLRHFLSTLPLMPSPGGMANAQLTNKETDDVVVFMMSLRDRH